MASSIVNSAAKQLGSFLVEETIYLCGVKRKVESLQKELAWMECFLRDADTQQHDDEMICKFVSHVQDLAYAAEDIIEKYLHEGRRLHRHDGIRNALKWFPRILCTSDCCTLHNLGVEIDELTTQLFELTSRWNRYGIHINRPRKDLKFYTDIREQRIKERTNSHTGEDVVGLEEDIQQVVDQLLKNDVKVVGISGISGLGKSALARKVFMHKEIKDHFNNCAWVYISKKEFDNMDIFQEILLGLEKGEEARKRIKEQHLKADELAGEISKVLQAKRCLVVLDDIWTVKTWERLKPAFESIFTITASSSSKILLTTKNQRLLWDVDKSGYCHLLQPLNEDDSWELLERKAFKGINWSSDASEVKYEQMEILGKKMLMHCNGLPLAVQALGGMLSTKYTTSEWEDLEKSISSYWMSDEAHRGMKVVELSCYHDLPFYLKPCFLYLGSFPRGYEISTQRLYNLWEADGLLSIEGKANKNGGISYDIGESYLEELVQRSMVQVGECWPSGRIKTCHVHDDIRDMCIRKCKEVSFLFFPVESENVASTIMSVLSNEIKKFHRCALYDEKGDWVDTCLKKGGRDVGELRSLLVFSRVGTTLQKIRKVFPLLRVLDLEGVDIESIDGVEHLIHLRYLSLRGSGVEVLPPSLYDLKFLETLDLRCRITRLKNEFYKMKRLMHLYLPWEFEVEGSEKLMFPVGSRMETIKNIDPTWCEMKELMQMTNLRIFSITSWYAFEKAEELKWVLDAPVIKKAGQLINSLRLSIDGDVIKEDPAILSSVAHHPCLNKLRVRGPLRLEDRNMGNANYATTLNSGTLFPDRLIRLELSYCEFGKPDMLDLKKLLHLKSLDLYGDITLGAEAGNSLRFSLGSFPQLTELRLTWQPEWEEWEVEDGALPHLQRLTLYRYSKLKKVKNMPQNLRQVVLYNNETGGGGDSLLLLLLALEKLPRLQQLVIIGCDIKWSLSPDSFLQLSTLEISFPVEYWEEWEWDIRDGALPNLKSLTLRRCKKNMVKNIPNNLTYVKLYYCEIGGDLFSPALEKHSRLQQLEIRYSEIAGGNKMSFSPGSFPQLSHLLLQGIQRLEEWVQQVGDGVLLNLKSLELNSCEKLTQLKNIPVSMKQVKLYKCNIGEGLLLSTLENLPQLEQLEIKDPMPASNKMSFSPSSFPRLTQLHLESIGDLEKWEVRERALPNLRRLELCKCSNLKKIEVGDGALPTLQHLKLKCCEKLKKLPEGLPDSIHIECEDPCIKGIEKYNTCPHFKKESSWGSKPRRWLHSSCA